MKVIPLTTKPAEEIVAALPVDRYRTELCPHGDHIHIIDMRPGDTTEPA